MAKWNVRSVQEFLNRKYPGKYKVIEWQNTKLRCKIECSCGNSWQPIGQQIVNKQQGCPACGAIAAANKNRLTLTDAQNRLDLAGKGLLIDPLTWKDTQHHCKVICSVGHSWVTKGTKVLNEASGCRKCFEESMRQWTADMVLDEAKLYSSRSEFQKKSTNAYKAAYFNFPDILNSVYPTRSCLYNTREILYVWEAVGSSPKVYKVGVTSKSRGLRRIEEVAQAADVRPNIILYKELPSLTQAAKAEKELSAIGSPVDVGRFNGSTEFRLFTDDQIADALLRYGPTSSLDD